MPVGSRIPRTKWYCVIGDATLTDAILDRLVHDTYRIKLINKLSQWGIKFMDSNNTVLLFPIKHEDVSSVEDECNAMEFYLREILHDIERLKDYDKSGREHTISMVKHDMKKVFQRSHRLKLIGRGQHIYKPR